jgi:hypothetical protein
MWGLYAQILEIFNALRFGPEATHFGVGAQFGGAHGVGALE